MTKDLDLFFEEYTVIMNHLQPDGENGNWNGCMFETYGSEIEFIKTLPNSRVWTLIEIDYDGMAILPGFRYVNRMGYFITKEEWSDENLEYIEYIEYQDLNFQDMTYQDLMEYCEDYELLRHGDEISTREELVTLCQDFRNKQVKSLLKN
jgi:hypothetical protein